MAGSSYPFLPKPRPIPQGCVYKWVNFVCTNESKICVQLSQFCVRKWVAYRMDMFVLTYGKISGLYLNVFDTWVIFTKLHGCWCVWSPLTGITRGQNQKPSLNHWWTIVDWLFLVLFSSELFYCLDTSLNSIPFWSGELVVFMGDGPTGAPIFRSMTHCLWTVVKPGKDTLQIL